MNKPNFKGIREAYRQDVADHPEYYLPEYGAASDRLGGKSWVWDFSRTFSPIERSMWDAIRGRGMFLLPQWPVGGYFLDFADPVRRYALECDGKDWHDADRDFRRDCALAEYGWTVYRVPGSKCWKFMDSPLWIHEDYFDGGVHEEPAPAHVANYIEEYFSTTPEGFLCCIANDDLARQFPDQSRRALASALSRGSARSIKGKRKSEMEQAGFMAASRRQVVEDCLGYLNGSLLGAIKAARPIATTEAE